MSTHRLRPSIVIGYLVAATVGVGCSAPGASDAAGTPTASRTSTADTEADTAPAQGTGEVVVAGATYTLASVNQCSFYPGGVVAIWGSTADGVLITFDVASATDVRLGVDNVDAGDGSVQWIQEAATPSELRLGDDEVSGATDLYDWSAAASGAHPATFEFSCP